MKEKLAEQDKELETLKITMKANELKSDGTETAKAAGEFISQLIHQA